MLTYPDLIACFTTPMLVGWRNSDDPAIATLPAEMTKSSSGLYFNDVDELVSLETAEAIKNTNTPLPTYLQRITEDSIVTLMQRFATENATVTQTKTLLEDTAIVSGAGNKTDTINKNGRFVGFRITTADFQNVRSLIKRIGLQFDTVQAEPLKIYVYSTAQNEPVQVVSVSNIRTNSIDWVTLQESDWLSLTGAYATYYVGYYEDDLSGRAINREFTGGPCYCPTDPYPKYKNYLAPKGIAVPASALDDTLNPDTNEPNRGLFDIDRVELHNSNFGLNLEPYVTCDISQMICRNKHLFARALQLMVANRLLNGILSSPEVNRLTQNDPARVMRISDTLQLQLFGGKDPLTELYYKGEVKKLQLDFSGIDSVCLPQVKSRLSIGSLYR